MAPVGNPSLVLLSLAIRNHWRSHVNYLYVKQKYITRRKEDACPIHKPRKVYCTAHSLCCYETHRDTIRYHVTCRLYSSGCKRAVSKHFSALLCVMRSLKSTASFLPRNWEFLEYEKGWAVTMVWVGDESKTRPHQGMNALEIWASKNDKQSLWRCEKY